MKYIIETITSRDEIEQLGTKEKFWFYDENNTKKLFKIGRPGTGEDWAEKVTYELAKLLGIPCAQYEFATWEERQGTVTTSFVPKDISLVHGNELLFFVHDGDYPRDERYHLTDYKLDIVLHLLESQLKELLLPPGYLGNEFIKHPIDLFIGYLIFDCWIANQDRHHENWGILLDSKEEKWYFAPTYDHAAGLGCKVSEEEAENRLSTNNRTYSVAHFVTRAKSSFYSDTDKQLKTNEVVGILADRYPKIVCYWIDKVENISEKNIQDILDKIPDNFMKEGSKKFAKQILYENKLRLLKIREEKCHE